MTSQFDVHAFGLARTSFSLSGTDDVPASGLIGSNQKGHVPSSRYTQPIMPEHLE